MGSPRSKSLCWDRRCSSGRLLPGSTMDWSMALAPAGGNRAGRRSSAPMIDRRQAIDGSGDPHRPRLDLQRELQGIKARLLQVAAVEPEPLLLRRPPHVPELALPRARVLGRARAQAPAFADLVGDLRADEVC